MERYLVCQENFVITFLIGVALITSSNPQFSILLFYARLQPVIKHNIC